MRVRILASHKEGTGKTTLAAPLAGEARRTGAGAVAVVETDPRGHYAPWRNTHVAAIPLSAALTLPQLPAHLPLLRDRSINLVILVTPLLCIKIRETTNTVAAGVRLPVRPHRHDCWTGTAMVEKGAQVRELLWLRSHWRHTTCGHGRRYRAGVCRAWTGRIRDDGRPRWMGL